MTADMIAKILDIHNTLRQQQAKGQTPNYPSANRMATVVSGLISLPLYDENINEFSALIFFSRDGIANWQNLL